MLFSPIGFVNKKYYIIETDKFIITNIFENNII